VREPATEEECFAWCVEALQECAEYAGERGVLLALENHGGITGSADQILRLVDAVNNDWLGINLDFGNFKGDVYPQFRRCAPRAVATHAKGSFHGASGAE